MTTENPTRTMSPVLLLPRLSKQIIRRAHPEVIGMDLRLLLGLSYLGDHDGAPQQELVDALCIDAKNVVLLLNELEDSGYLIRRRDADDRRRHRVHITPEGRAALDRSNRVAEGIEDDVFRALDSEERATLVSLLARALRDAESAHREGCVPEPAVGLVSGQ